MQAEDRFHFCTVLSKLLSSLTVRKLAFLHSSNMNQTHCELFRIAFHIYPQKRFQNNSSQIFDYFQLCWFLSVSSYPLLQYYRALCSFHIKNVAQSFWEYTLTTQVVIFGSTLADDFLSHSNIHHQHHKLYRKKKFLATFLKRFYLIFPSECRNLFEISDSHLSFDSFWAAIVIL